MNRYKEKTCHSCRYRHCCFKYEPPTDGDCKHWKMGDCYTCKFVDADEEEWYKRGCECWCFGGCKKYKRNWKRFFEILFEKINKGA